MISVTRLVSTSVFFLVWKYSHYLSTWHNIDSTWNNVAMNIISSWIPQPCSAPAGYKWSCLLAPLVQVIKYMDWYVVYFKHQFLEAVVALYYNTACVWNFGDMPEASQISNWGPKMQPNSHKDQFTPTQCISKEFNQTQCETAPLKLPHSFEFILHWLQTHDSAAV